jgi:hypothetical protein
MTEQPFTPAESDLDAIARELDERFGAEGAAQWIEPRLPTIHDHVELADTQAANWVDLERLYYTETDAAKGLAVFRQLQDRPRKLDHLLRDHEVMPVIDPGEQLARDAFDDLLSFCGVLEVALELRYVDRLAAATVADLSQVLWHNSVRRYYERHYPLLLPQLLRVRLAGGRYYQAHQGPLQLAAFQRAVELDTRLMRHPEVLTFLALADGFWIEGYNRRKLVALAKRPGPLFESLTRSKKQRSVLDQAAQGLRGFLFLTDGLYRVLGSLEGDPVFQSALWHLFGYWFAERRETVVASLKEMLASIAAWPADTTRVRAATADPTLPEPGSRRSRELDAAIEALASERFARPLREGFQQAVRY